jgi:dephospho-CoA kinase
MQMTQKSVIGVAGMPGSGKATVKTMAESLGYPVIVMGDEVREETRRIGLQLTPENIGGVMLQLREEEGPAAVAKRCIPKIEKTESNIVFVDGIRSLSEVEEFKKRFRNFTLIAVHSSPKMRFQRLCRRKRSDDPQGWDVFNQRDLRELTVGLGNVIAVADYMIVNQGTYEEFKVQVRQVLEAAIPKWTR